MNKLRTTYLHISILIVAIAVCICQSATAQTTNREFYRNSAKTIPGNSLYGEWIIISAGTTKFNDRDNIPYINFNESDGRIYGNMGLNYVNASFQTKQGGALTLTDITYSQNPSGNKRGESAIVESLKGCASFETAKKKDGIYYLKIFDKKGNTILYAKRHNANILSGVWNVKKIKGVDVSDSKIEIVIDVPELKLHGKIGCNVFNGDVGLNRNKDWFIQFQNITVSKLACSTDLLAIERELLIALEEVEYIAKGSKSITLQDKSKIGILELKKVEDK